MNTSDTPTTLPMALPSSPPPPRSSGRRAQTDRASAQAPVHDGAPTVDVSSQPEDSAGTGAASDACGEGEPDSGEVATIGTQTVSTPGADAIIYLDPAACVVSPANGRDVSALAYASCEPLITAIAKAGMVIEPLSVRLRPDGRYEILCGARRHWSVTWLRAHGHPDMMLPAVVRDLTDEQAFRIAELHHHGHVGLSAFELGDAYARALRQHYRRDQKRLADALGRRPATVSVLVALAAWPADMLAAYSSRHDILEADAARITPLLARAGRRELVLAEAGRLKAEQARRHGVGEPPLARASVTAKLLAAGRLDQGPLAVTDADGEVIALLRSRAGEDGFAVVVRAVERRDPLVLGRALRLLVAQHAAGRRGTVTLNAENAIINEVE